jgi:hypothetical protein
LRSCQHACARLWSEKSGKLERTTLANVDQREIENHLPLYLLSFKKLCRQAYFLSVNYIAFSSQRTYFRSLHVCLTFIYFFYIINFFISLIFKLHCCSLIYVIPVKAKTD